MRILGSDFDGTLNFGGIDERKIQAIEMWRAAGNKFGIVSGRSIQSCLSMLGKHPGLKVDFFAACNGACITDGSGRILCEERCSLISPLQLVEMIVSLGGEVVWIQGDESICYEVPISDDSLRRLTETTEYYQVSTKLPTPEDAKAFTEQMRFEYGDALNPMQNGRSVDIVAKLINKAEGLRRVASHFDAKCEDIIAVGDNLNDLDMIRAFRSYAMENGVAEVKSLAGATVESVADLIEIEMKGFVCAS